MINKRAPSVIWAGPSVAEARRIKTWTSGDWDVNGGGGITFAEYATEYFRGDIMKEMRGALQAAHDFIADQYADAASQALAGEFVSDEARPVWSKICDALAKADEHNV